MAGFVKTDVVTMVNHTNGVPQIMAGPTTGIIVKQEVGSKNTCVFHRIVKIVSLHIFSREEEKH